MMKIYYLSKNIFLTVFNEPFDGSVINYPRFMDNVTCRDGIMYDHHINFLIFQRSATTTYLASYEAKINLKTKTA